MTNEHYKPFEGRINVRMFYLIKEGYLPISLAGAMEQRCKGKWYEQYIHTGDAVVRYPDGSAVIVRDAEPLRNIHPQNQLSDGLLVLEGDVAEALRGQGMQLNKSNVEEIQNRYWSREEIEQVDAWQYLARERDLFKRYADIAFGVCQKKFRSSSKFMSLYFPYPQKNPILGCWCFNNFEFSSNATSHSHIDGRYSYLVGVPASNTQTEEPKTLEQRI